MRILVCGSRGWDDIQRIRQALGSLRIVLSWEKHNPTGDEVHTVVHGGARGADTLAGQVAEEFGWEVEEHPADWSRMGRAAGQARNQEMLDSGVGVVVAFKDGFGEGPSFGTEHMVSIAAHSRVPTVLFSHDHPPRAVFPAVDGEEPG